MGWVFMVLVDWFLLDGACYGVSFLSGDDLCKRLLMLHYCHFLIATHLSADTVPT
jgi:hypothetical protein